MLYDVYGQQLSTLLIPREAWKPYPTAADRLAWEGLPTALRQYLLAHAEQYLRYEWPALPATLFMEFKRVGNRSHYEKQHFARRNALAALTLAECCAGQGHFLDDIINGIWCICEESFWGVPAHSSAAGYPGAPLPNVDEPTIDLFAAETGGLLAWVHYLLGPALDAVSPLIRERIRREIKYRILDPCLERDDFWWMGLKRGRGLNNWTPWCYSNCLTATLLLETNPERRQRAVGRAMQGLDAFLAEYPADGGCDEGTSYWSRAGGSLFDCLELLYSASAGGINVYNQPLVANMGRYLYRAHIDGNYFVNFADGGAKVDIAADLVYRYGRRIQDPQLMALGAAAYQERQTAGQIQQDSLLRMLPAIFNYTELVSASAQAPYVRDSWLPGLQFMTARASAGSSHGLYVAAKGGHNAESHNHNDVGQFIVYANGRPVLIDIGVETYTAKTFSDHRYEIWTMQSGYHNLPTVNGYGQQAGANFRASSVNYVSNDALAELSLDIAQAYPKEAGLTSWLRTIRLIRSGNGRLELYEQFNLQAPGTVTESFITPCEPQISEGVIHLPAVSVQIAVSPAELVISSECLPVNDARLKPVWGDRLYRLLITSVAPIQTGNWQFSINQV